MRLWSRPLLSAVFASALGGYLLAIFMAYLGIRLDRIGATAFIIGLMFFSRNFFQIFMRVPFGELAQIVGRKPLITLGTLFYVIAFGLMSVAKSWPVVFGATFSVAVGMALYWPAMFSYIGDISNDDYGKINGIIFQGSDVGVILGTLLSSILLRRNIVDLSGLFGIGTLIGFGGTVVIYFTLSEVLDPEERLEVDSIPVALKTSFVDSIYSLKKMSTTKPLGKIYLFQLVISFTEYFFNSFFPLILVLSMGYSDSQVSDIIFITTLIIFFFKPYLGSISDKFGFRNPVLIALTITALSLVALTLTSQFIVVVIIYGIMISSSLTSYLAVNGATSYAAEDSSRGLAMGALGFWVSFGRSSSSVILTPIWSWFEFIYKNDGQAIRSIFLVAAGIILMSVVVLYILSQEIRLEHNYTEDDQISDV